MITTDTRWLERHGRKWRVTVAVPRDMQGTLGTRLKYNLHTESLAVANRLKAKVVADLQDRIHQERERKSKEHQAALQDKGHVQIVTKSVDTDLYSDTDVKISNILISVLGLDHSNRHKINRVRKVLVSCSQPRVSAHYQTTYGNIQEVKLSTYHELYLEKSLVNARTKSDDVRAIRYLAQWCEREGIPQTLQAIDRKIAMRFMDQFDALSGGLAARTQNKYLSRISSYWRFMLRREYVKNNPWQGVVVEVPRTKYNEEERAFRDAEVRALLIGNAEPRLMDLMLIAALTGARLDAIVDLRVRDVADGAFTFKPQKKERTARDVPIHSELASIVTRRTTGRSAEDAFFPEWPAPIKEGSLRERSFKASNRFTEYRRACGVDETVVGKRRSLVNFHSFRRWFITKAERAGNSGDLVAALVGHKRLGITLGRYSEGPEWGAARRCVESIKLPTLGDAAISEARPLLPRHRSRQGS